MSRTRETVVVMRAPALLMLVSLTSGCSIAGIAVGSRLAVVENERIETREARIEAETGCVSYEDDVEEEDADEDRDDIPGTSPAPPICKPLPRVNVALWGTTGFLIGLVIDSALIYALSQVRF